MTVEKLSLHLEDLLHRLTSVSHDYLIIEMLHKIANEIILDCLGDRDV